MTRDDEFCANMLIEINQSERQIESGHYVNHEDIKAWLLSWGSANELPLPRCVCGEEHTPNFLSE